MARPRKEGLDYFPHDVDASSDEKIEVLMALYGARGYAFYFILLERIYRTGGLELDISSEQTVRVLAKKIAISAREFMQILESALECGLFDRREYEQRRVLTSDGIKRRAMPVLKKREKMQRSRASYFAAPGKPLQISPPGPTP